MVQSVRSQVIFQHKAKFGSLVCVCGGFDTVSTLDGVSDLRKDEESRTKGSGRKYLRKLMPFREVEGLVVPSCITSPYKSK